MALALVVFVGGGALAYYAPALMPPEPAPVASEPMGANADEDWQAEPEPDQDPPPSWEDEPERPRTRAERLRSAASVARVTVYSTDWCPYCRRAEAHLDSLGVSYEKRNIERDASAREANRRLNPRGSVPTIAVGNEVVLGFSARGMEDAILRATGY